MHTYKKEQNYAILISFLDNNSSIYMIQDISTYNSKYSVLTHKTIRNYNNHITIQLFISRSDVIIEGKTCKIHKKYKFDQIYIASQVLAQEIRMA